jgi:hypothetical protein
MFGVQRAAAWLELLAETPEKLDQSLAPVDALTCATNLKGSQVLRRLQRGKRAEALWKTAGQQKVVWYDDPRVRAALLIVPALEQMVAFLKAE